MSFLGIDVGTTGCKAVAFDAEGRILASAYREYPLLHPRPGWSELDPGVVWSRIEECLREANARLGGDPVRCLAVSCQGEAVVPVSADGRVLANSPVSFDTRTIPQVAHFARRIGAERVALLTGHPLHTMYSLPKILWWHDEQPEVFRETWKFLCYGDFVAWKLGVEPVIDHTMASRTMGFDIRARRWSAELLGIAGLEEDRLARPAPSATVIGVVPRRVAERLGLPPGVVVATGGHDQPCGALGAGVLREGTAMYAIGTTECIAPAFPAPLDGLVRDGYPCYPHVAPGLYVTLAGNFTGGALLRWYRDVLGADERRAAAASGRDVYEQIIEQITDRPSRLFVLPHFSGSGAPHNDPEARGAIVGLTFDTTREDIVKAILEGTTFELAMNLERIRERGAAVGELRAIGGGARSRTWMRMKADIMATPLVTLDVGESVCLGAALLAGRATGAYGSLEEAVERTVRVRERFAPDPGRVAFYRDRRGVYEQLYPALKPVNPRI
jgi:xylulokinase